MIAMTAYRERALAMLDKAGATEMASNLANNITSVFHQEPIPATIWRDELDHDEYLAVCLFAKNQALDLIEWFQHHYYNMGIRRFYVMDDGSNPPLSTFIDEYGIPEDSMDFIYHTDPSDVPQGAQPYVQFSQGFLESLLHILTTIDRRIYDECAHVYGVNNTWLAFIDSDEFLDIPSGETLEEILNDLDTDPKIGALGINWQMHSSSHQLTRAASSRKTYLECITDGDDKMGETGNKHVKSIVRVDAYVSPSKSLASVIITLHIVILSRMCHADRPFCREPTHVQPLTRSSHRR